MAIFSWFHTILNGTANVLFRCVLRCFRFVFSMGLPRKQINPSMASSSSSFDFTPLSSSSQSWTHHVFLSFRGTDTRNTFVAHLRSALDQRGIHTYKDDETLPRGEAIGPSLLKAIEESQIAVIVFSENYADSSWCLQELAHIMKCKDERDLIVMPIFFHIDPSEVRKQKGKYGKALAKHKSQNVESWRKALVDAGNLSGDVADRSTCETIFINKIVDTINRLCVAVSSDNEGLIGIKVRLHDLQSKREMESDDVVMVGIWGSGGGGKTTLASSLYDEISRKFDVCCFVENIREKSSKSDGLPNLQETILSVVLNQTHIHRVEDGRRLIKDRFCRKKVLIVLDDVDRLDQLEALAGSHDWFGEGSRIIITTRDKHLLTAHKVNVIYNISLLDPVEAMKLFRKHAPQHGRPIEEYEMLSKEVVSYAGGLPLALKVLGSFLCDKDMTDWTSALERLKEIPNSDIVQKLKVSYDGLEPLEKELFLDIACFFRRCAKYKAMEILDACGFYPDIGVKVLMEKALITVTGPEGFEQFDMHDLVQEMAHHIVRGENPKNPELHSRVWQEEEVAKMDLTKENDNNQALQVLRQSFEDFPTNFLRVVGNMKKLRWIWVKGYRGTLLPSEFQPTKLCYLGSEESLIEQLWEGYKVLPNLKVINLTRAYYPVKTPDFNGLPCLERLILRYCNSLKEIHPSIGYHERLTFLDMEGCESLEIFPPIIRMKKLKTLILSYCAQLHKFPEIKTSMDNLKELCLNNSGIEVLPLSVGEYCTNLHSLDLRYCHDLHSIEGNFRRLKYLKRLHLEGCGQLKNIPAEGLFDIECCLQLLSSFRHLHQGIVNLKLFGFSSSLKKLNLGYCNLVDGDISSVLYEELVNLQALDLRGNMFSQLHSSLSQLPRLKFLNLSYCKNLVELPDLPSSISVLIAEMCFSLDVTGDFPTNLKWLWNVLLSGKNSNVESVLQSMLQGNAIEDYYISIQLDGPYIPIRGFAYQIFTLQLPWNWKNTFSGFLVYIDGRHMVHGDVITIKEVIGKENKGDILEVSNEDEESKKMSGMCYISCGSLKETSWWNSTHGILSFSVSHAYRGRKFCLKVELVPKRSQGDDPIERPKDPTYNSKFWDENSLNRNTFRIIHDSMSCIEIQHLERYYDVFDRI